MPAPSGGPVWFENYNNIYDTLYPAVQHDKLSNDYLTALFKKTEKGDYLGHKGINFVDVYTAYHACLLYTIGYASSQTPQPI